VTRQVVYAGGLSDPTIYYGDHEIQVRTGYVHLDVTDDGFVYTTPGTLQKGDPRVWFSDGGKPEQIGTHCGGGAARSLNDVMTGSSGSLVVWFECPEAGAGLTLVGYDTSVGREVFHWSIPGCNDGTSTGLLCELTAVVGEHVYLSHQVGNSNFVRGVVLDVGTGSVRAVTPKYYPAGGLRTPAAYLAELRRQARALVVGDNVDSGTVTEGIGLGFAVSGSRLVPLVDVADPAGGTSGQRPTKAYDTTGRAVQFHIPVGYHRAGGFHIVEWLDDDTVALATGGQGPYSGDVLTCHLSDGRCKQVVTGPGSDTGVGQRLFPQQGLPA
jgi:hypothetical protein